MYEPIKDEDIAFSTELHDFYLNYDNDYNAYVRIYVKNLTNYLKLENNQELIINHITLDGLSLSFSNENKLLTEEISYINKDGIHKTNHLENDEIILSNQSLESAIPSFSTNFLNYQKEHPNLTYAEAINEFILLNIKDISAVKVNGSSPFLLKDKNDFKVFKIVGYSFDDYNYFGEHMIDEYMVPEKNIFGLEFYVKDDIKIKELFGKYNEFNVEINQIPGIKYNSFYRYSTYSLNIDNIHYFVKKYAFWLMAVFIIFSITLVYNF